MDSNRTEKTHAARRRILFPPRALNQLMTVVALSGLAMAALGPRAAVTPTPPRRLAPPLIWSLNAPSPQPPAQSWAPDGRFVVAAPEGLDPQFIVAAPPGIDDRIIANPGGPAASYEAMPGMPDVWVVPVPPPSAGR